VIFDHRFALIALFVCFQLREQFSSEVFSAHADFGDELYWLAVFCLLGVKLWGLRARLSLHDGTAHGPTRYHGNSPRKISPGDQDSCAHPKRSAAIRSAGVGQKKGVVKSHLFA
jgi:hypothetical protein